MYIEPKFSDARETTTLNELQGLRPKQRGEPSEECADLRQWSPTPTILAWIERELQNLSSNDSAVREALEQNPGGRIREMLSVLTFAYVSQMFDSEEIATACRVQETFGQLCAGRPPFAYELQSFRHKHRALLERLLTRVLVRAIKAKFDLDASLITAELEQDLSERARQRLDIARHLDAGQTW